MPFFPAKGAAYDLWAPSDHNLKAWNYDPLTTQNTDVRLPAASVRIVRVPITETITVDTFVMYNFRNGSGLTANQNFMAIYSRSGNTFTRERLSGDLSGVWNTGGIKNISTGTSITLQPPDIYVGFMTNGGTPPAPYAYEMPSGVQEVGLNGNTNAEKYKWRVGSFGSGITAMPTTFDISAFNSYFLYPWVGLR